MATFGSISKLADYLIDAGDGNWNYFLHDLLSPGVVTVNITGLTAAEQNLANSALNAWHEVCNITFKPTSGPADITYEHGGSRAVTYWGVWETLDFSTPWPKAIITIPSDWDSAWDGSSIYSYMYQTYLHETGHALGLGHLGPYDKTATYGVDNIFTNDTYQWSLMSYFGQSNYGGASDRYVVTPQMADIYAVQSLYGWTSTRAGNTTYGFNSNAGMPYDFNKYFFTGAPAFTIYDSGGIDTLDCSGYWKNQVIDLTPGHWSSIGGYVNNIGIYLSSDIENAVGGHGDDVIIAGYLKGTLTGGGGNDIFQGRISELGSLAGCTITDMNVGDRLNFTDAISLGTFSHTQIGTSLSYTDYGYTYQLTLSNNPIGHFIEVSDFFFGGVDLKLAAADPHLHDFNGDDRSDFLFRNDNGANVLWEMNGGIPIVRATLPTVGTDWHIQTTGDFDGNNTSDILWRNDNGATGLWFMNGASATGVANLGVVGNDWHFAETGDFNGDGKNDILWRNDNGAVGLWEMNGGTPILQTLVGVVGPDWHLEKTGDLNGDGKSDILWRNDNGTVGLWEMNGASPIYQGGLGIVGNDAHIAGLADFNGDGNTDILWRYDNGTTTLWFMNGASTIGTANLGVINPAWHVVDTADVNDDGMADILWRHDTGLAGLWEMNGATPILQASLGVISNDWHIIA
jgi:serralysin